MTQSIPQGSATFVLSDALEFLDSLPDQCADLLISSPPYFMGKEYDTSLRASDLEAIHRQLGPKLCRVLKPGRSLCWQTGNHVHKHKMIPLDILVVNDFAPEQNLHLRNTIVWTFSHGTHSSKRFSGRHETILWFTQGHKYHFDLDAVRVPQKYPGKKHYKGPRKGEWSGNPAGKNPGDVWDIP